MRYEDGLYRFRTASRRRKRKECQSTVLFQAWIALVWRARKSPSSSAKSQHSNNLRHINSNKSPFMASVSMSELASFDISLKPRRQIQDDRGERISKAMIFKFILVKPDNQTSLAFQHLSLSFSQPHLA